jgi:hypothetical protein
VPTSLSAQKRRGYCGSTICGCLVIVHHSVEPYASARTMYTRLPDPPVPGRWAFLEVNAAFGMGIWFLLGGIFTPGSVDRRGLAGFLRDRAVRLGIPLIFAFLLLIPFEGWFYHLAYEPWPAVGYWDYFVHYFLGFGGRPPNWPESRWPDANFGHLWFVEHLLLYSFSRTPQFDPAAATQSPDDRPLCNRSCRSNICGSTLVSPGQMDRLLGLRPDGARPPSAIYQPICDRYPGRAQRLARLDANRPRSTVASLGYSAGAWVLPAGRQWDHQPYE